MLSVKKINATYRLRNLLMKTVWQRILTLTWKEVGFWAQTEDLNGFADEEDFFCDSRWKVRWQHFETNRGLLLSWRGARKTYQLLLKNSQAKIQLTCLLFIYWVYGHTYKSLLQVPQGDATEECHVITVGGVCCILGLAFQSATRLNEELVIFVEQQTVQKPAWQLVVHHFMTDVKYSKNSDRLSS